MDANLAGLSKCLGAEGQSQAEDLKVGVLDVGSKPSSPWGEAVGFEFPLDYMLCPEWG